MDDDDIEDIYEDLKDVGEDVEKRDESDELRTWMSCQLRWWKTRIHRKHRAEDLVKGCGRQLMHWQLRVLCKQQQQQQRDKPASTLPYRRYCEAVMSQMTPNPTVFCRKHPCNRLLNGVRASGNHDSSEKTGDLSDEVLLKNVSRLDGGWYFRRVQDREDHRPPSPQWYFDRADERQFSRSDANWYIRAMRHNAVTDSDHQHSSDGAVKGQTGLN